MIRITAILMTVFALVMATGVAYADGDITGIAVRYSVSTQKVRVVLDLPKEATIVNQSTPTAVVVAVNIPLANSLAPVTITDPVVTGVTVTPDAKRQAVLTVSLAKPSKCTVFTLPAADGKPFRVVVDVLKLFTKEERQTLSPAIQYLRIERQTEDHYTVAHLVEVNTSDPHVRVDAVAAQGERERVAAMVERTGAVCGVNGGFFLDSTRPVGLVKVDNQVRSMPIWGRTAVAFPGNGQPILGNPAGVWRMTLPDGTTRDLPDWMDASILPQSPTAAVQSGATFAQTPANPGGVTAIIRDGKVVARPTDATPLTPGDVAIRLRGDEAKALDGVLVVGAAVTMTPVLTPAWTEYIGAVGAGPRLLRDGEVEITADAERIPGDIRNGRAARTALGLTADGRMLLLVAEAPKPFDTGMTLEEIANLLKAHGALQAINLDGGGSSNLAIGATTVNYPPNTWIRPVADGILVFDDRVKPTPPTTAPASEVTTAKR